MNQIVADDGTGGGDPEAVLQSSVDARLKYAFELCLSRGPTEAELERLRLLYANVRAEFEADEETAEKVLGDFKADGASRAEAAAWFVVARAIMNLDEFITRE
jgi:hypothetical protein